MEKRVDSEAQRVSDTIRSIGKRGGALHKALAILLSVLLMFSLSGLFAYADPVVGDSQSSNDASDAISTSQTEIAPQAEVTPQANITIDGVTWSYTDTGSAITITGRSGYVENVIVPASINGKPVTRIDSSADVSGNSTTTIPASVTWLGDNAFSMDTKYYFLGAQPSVETNWEATFTYNDPEGIYWLAGNASSWSGAEYGYTYDDFDDAGIDTGVFTVPTSVSVTQGSTLSLGAGETTTLTAQNVGGGSYLTIHSPITWTSSNTTVATVTNAGAVTVNGGATPGATVTLTAANKLGLNNYPNQSATVTLTVTGADDIDGATVTAIADQTYTGSAITPSLDDKVSYGDATLTSPTDYTVSYEDNIAVGTATVTITGQGSYNGTKTVHFEIVPVVQTAGDWKYTEVSSEATIVGYTGASGASVDIVVPATIGSGSTPVTALGTDVLKGLTVRTVSIPASIDTIADLALYNLTGIVIFRGAFPDNSSSTATDGVAKIWYPSTEETSWADGDLGAAPAGSYDPDWSVSFNGVQAGAYSATITTYAGSATSLEIPVTFVGLPVNAIASGAVSGPTTDVTIPGNITSIAAGAFIGVTGDVTFLGTPPAGADYATEFKGASGGAYTGTLLYPLSESAAWKASGWTSYDTDFWATSNLADYTFKPVDGGYAITGYTGSARDIALPTSYLGYPVVAIDREAFSGSGITSISIPSSIKSIGREAFYSARYLKYVNIEEGLQEIGMHAFWYNKALEEITLPASLTTLGEGPFVSDALQNIYVADGSTSFSSVNGVLFNADKTELVVYPMGRTAASYIVPSTVKTIGEEAFRGDAGDILNALTAVTLPNGLEEIGWGAFWNAESLAAIEIPNSVTTLAEHAFSSCGDLASIKLPATISYIPGYFADFSYSLTNIDIPDTVKTIGDSAFMSSSLETLTIPEGVTEIQASAFDGNSKLTSLSLPSTLVTIGDHAFYYLPLLTEIDLTTTSVQTIGAGAFAQTGISSITIPNTLISMGNAAFMENYDLEEIIFEEPSQLATIPSQTFAWDYKLTSITIPASVTSIGYLAFYNTFYLEEATFLNPGVWTLDPAAFYRNPFDTPVDEVPWADFLQNIHGIPGSSTAANFGITDDDLLPIVHPVPTDAVSIAPSHAAKTLGIDGNSKTPGQNIVLQTVANTASQSFVLEDAGDGYYYIKNIHSGLVLDIYGNSTKAGTEVIQWTASPGKNNQLWSLTEAGNGYLVSSKANPNLYLDIFGGSSSDGAKLIVWTLKGEGSANQIFKLTLPQTPIAADAHTVTLSNGLALDIYGKTSTPGGKAILWTANGAPNQQFTFTFHPELGFYTISANHSNLLLDVYGASTAPGASVIQWATSASTPRSHQLWNVSPAAGGGYTITSALNGLVLDAKGGANPGADIITWTSKTGTAKANQIWFIR